MQRSSAGARTSIGSAPSRNRVSKIPQGSGRSSFGTRSSTGGKLSIGGSNRILSSQKRSVGGMVSKVGATSRRSSGYGRGYGHDVLKDPRPITSKPYKEKAVRKLIEFLSRCSYPHQLSPKMLVSPMSRDFLYIFEFLARLLDSSIKLGKKPEEEIPAIFKRLRYPFPISKSAMFAVGSPHTWPSLLAALTWLREVIEIYIQMDPEKELFQAESFDFDGVSEAQYIFEYCEKTYAAFLEGTDTFGEFESDLEVKIRSCGEMADMEHILVENDALKAELKHLKEQPDLLVPLKQKLSTMSLDIEKGKAYDMQIEEHTRAKSDLLQQKDLEMAALEQELQALLSENEKKQQIFDAQEFSLEDVERINMDRQQLLQGIETVEGDLKNLDQQIWNLEMTNAKCGTRIERKCAEYNQLAIEVGVVSASGDIEHGASDFRITGKASRLEEEASNFVKYIKPGLFELNHRAEQELLQAEGEYITESEAADQMRELVNDKEQTISLLEIKHKRIEDTIEAEKTHLAAQQKLMHEETYQLQDELIEIRMRSDLSVQGAESHLNGEQAKFKARDEKRKKLEKTLGNFLEQVVELLAAHKTTIQEHTELLKNKMEEAYEKNRQFVQSRGFLLNSIKDV